MKKSQKLLLILPIAFGLSAPVTSAEPKKTQLTDRQQVKYDARLAGRTAGKPVSCLNRFERDHMTVISDDVILFGRRRNAKTIYVNKPRGGCHGAERNALITRSISTNLCKGQIVQVQDLVSGSFQGSCVWNEFIPYTKDAG